MKGTMDLADGHFRVLCIVRWKLYRDGFVALLTATLKWLLVGI